MAPHERAKVWELARSLSLAEYRAVYERAGASRRKGLAALKRGLKQSLAAGVRRSRQQADLAHPCSCEGGVIFVKRGHAEFSYSCTACLRARLKGLPYPPYRDEVAS